MSEHFFLVDGGSLPSSYCEAQDRIFREAGVSWVTEHASRNDVLGAYDQQRDAGFLGANFTTPFAAGLEDAVDIRAASAQLAGGLDLMIARSGKRLGYFVGAQAAVLALERLDGPLHDKDMVVCGVNPTALAFVHAFAEAGARGITLLAEDKERAKAAMEAFLERFGRLSLATIELPAAFPGHRSFREAFERTTFRFGSYEGSQAASQDAQLICHTSGARSYHFRPDSAAEARPAQRVLLTEGSEGDEGDSFLSRARAAGCLIYGPELHICGRAALSQQTLLALGGVSDEKDFAYLYDRMLRSLEVKGEDRVSSIGAHSPGSRH